jgi:hypothetical protein
MLTGAGQIIFLLNRERSRVEPTRALPLPRTSAQVVEEQCSQDMLLIYSQVVLGVAREDFQSTDGSKSLEIIKGTSRQVLQFSYARVHFVNLLLRLVLAHILVHEAMEYSDLEELCAGAMRSQPKVGDEWHHIDSPWHGHGSLLVMVCSSSDIS